MERDRNLGHAGERELRERFGSTRRWDDFTLQERIQPFVAGALSIFIEAQPFFFIATASAEGHCDANFRGTQNDAEGRALPAIKVLDPRQLVFPDYRGNGLFNSLGNIRQNPHIGLLFINFEFQRRARVNGVATIIEADEAIRAIWPAAQAAVRVEVEQAYDNCAARIPRMKPL